MALQHLRLHLNTEDSTLPLRTAFVTSLMRIYKSKEIEVGQHLAVSQWLFKQNESILFILFSFSAQENTGDY